MSIKRDRKHSQKGVHGKQQQIKEAHHQKLKKEKGKLQDKSKIGKS